MSLININLTGLSEDQFKELKSDALSIKELIIINHQKLIKMGQELDDLKAAVAKNTTVEQGAITLLQGLKGKLDAAIASGNPADLKALSDELGSSDQALADAITANTPADASATSGS